MNKKIIAAVNDGVHESSILLKITNALKVSLDSTSSLYQFSKRVQLFSSQLRDTLVLRDSKTTDVKRAGKTIKGLLKLKTLTRWRHRRATDQEKEAVIKKRLIVQLAILELEIKYCQRTDPRHFASYNESIDLFPSQQTDKLRKYMKEVGGALDMKVILFEWLCRLPAIAKSRLTWRTRHFDLITAILFDTLQIVGQHLSPDQKVKCIFAIEDLHWRSDKFGVIAFAMERANHLVKQWDLHLERGASMLVKGLFQEDTRFTNHHSLAYGLIFNQTPAVTEALLYQPDIELTPGHINDVMAFMYERVEYPQLYVVMQMYTSELRNLYGQGLGAFPRYFEGKRDNYIYSKARILEGSVVTRIPERKMFQVEPGSPYSPFEQCMMFLCLEQLSVDWGIRLLHSFYGMAGLTDDHYDNLRTEFARPVIDAFLVSKMEWPGRMSAIKIPTVISISDVTQALKIERYRRMKELRENEALREAMTRYYDPATPEHEEISLRSQMMEMLKR